MHCNDFNHFEIDNRKKKQNKTKNYTHPSPKQNTKQDKIKHNKTKQNEIISQNYNFLLFTVSNINCKVNQNLGKI